jgi:hypothetical protein
MHMLLQYELQLNSSFYTKLRVALETGNAPVYFPPDSPDCASRIITESLVYSCGDAFECMQCTYTRRGCELQLISLSEQPSISYAFIFRQHSPHVKQFNRALTTAMDEFTARREALLNDFDPCADYYDQPYTNGVLRALTLYGLSGAVLLLIVGVTLAILVAVGERVVLFVRLYLIARHDEIIF